MMKKLEQSNTTPLELKILGSLRPRMNASTIQTNRWYNLQKGHAGEIYLHHLLKKELPPRYFLLSDLLLEHQHTKFQIDLLLISNNSVYLLEVKNYEGNYVIQHNDWYATPSRVEISNPLHQLKRSEVLLQQLLQKTSFRFSIKPYLVFINPTFQLYQAPLDAPIIFRTQLNQFVKQLYATSFEQTPLQKRLATFLTSKQLPQSPRERLPDYDFSSLRKGIVCGECSAFVVSHNNWTCTCSSCGHKESIEAAVKRSIQEFAILFPNQKVTASIIQEWCQIIKTRKTILKILNNHCTLVRSGRYAYYTINK